MMSRFVKEKTLNTRSLLTKTNFCTETSKREVSCIQKTKRKVFLIIHAKVKPGSPFDELEKTGDGGYLIHTKSKAIDGKANLSVIKALAKEFGVSFKNVFIKNPKSKKKIIKITL